RRKGAATRRAKRRSRAQESRGRTSTTSSGRKSETTFADLALQVRVPGQHVTRVAHAVKQPAHSFRPAFIQPGRQSHFETGRVCSNHLGIRQRLAQVD